MKTSPPPILSAKLEAKKAREINKPTLLQAFNEHLAVSENKHITESHMLSKKQIKKLIISQKINENISMRLKK